MTATDIPASVGIDTAIVLVGGRGTRLGALTDATPKPLVDVAGRPFLTYVLDYLAREGVRRIILATGYLGERFAAVIGHRYGPIEIAYSHESQPLGTGGAIAQALRIATAPAAFVLNGDTYFPVRLSDLTATHQTNAAALTMALRHVPDATRFGAVVCSGSRVAAMREKGVAGPGDINGGLYLVARDRLLADAPDGAFSLEHELLPAWIAAGRVAAMPSAAYMIDIGVPDDLARARHEFRDLPR